MQKAVIHTALFLVLALSGLFSANAFAHHKPGHPHGPHTTTAPPPTTTGTVPSVTTYYVSKEGGAADANPGTIGSPWLTVAKVTGFALNPGDVVLFRGGDVWPEQFGSGQDGSSGNPIRFGSYGTGKPTFQAATGAVYLLSATYLTFEDLIFDSGGSHLNIFSGVLTDAGGTGVHHVDFNRCEVRNFRRGFNLGNTGHHITINRGLIEKIGGSGIITGRSDPPTAGVAAGTQEFATITENVIQDTGLDPAAIAVDGALHGIYNDWRNSTIRGNTVVGFDNSGISNRYRDATIEDNYIDGQNRGAFGIAFHSYEVSGQQGTTKMTYNKIKNVTTNGIYVSANGGVGVPDTQEHLTIANNSFYLPAGVVGSAYVTVEKTTGFLRIKNNLATGNAYRTLDVNYNPTGGYEESNNIWHTTVGTYRLRFNGTEHATVAAYQSASGQGASDLSTDPTLETGAMTITSSSTAYNAGTATVTGLTYVNTCTGLPYSYCGAAPEIGAHEVATVLTWHGRGYTG